MKMALLEASKGEVGPTIAKTLLFCFAYDAENKKYVFAWEKIIGTGMSLAAIGLFIWLMISARKNRTSLTKEEYYRRQEEDHHKKGENDE
jgi:protein SCO1/2